MSIKVAIGIQARSGSTRFPRKVFVKIAGKSVLQHVIDTCNQCAKYMNRHANDVHPSISVHVLVPFKDDIIPAFSKKIDIIEGPEDDVLTRYKSLVDNTSADYFVRITSDCVLLPDFLITKLIKIAVMNRYDYVSNVDEKYRTSPDGYDVEVISRDMLLWVAKEATDPFDREHVTTLIRRYPPDWAKIGAVVGFLDQSDFKISLDTKEDLEKIEKLFNSVKKKIALAEEQLGQGRVHKF